MTGELNDLVEGPAVLPRERWGVDCAERRRDVLVADRRALLLARGRHLPLGRVVRAVLRLHRSGGLTECGQQGRAALFDRAAVLARVATAHLAAKDVAQVLLYMRRAGQAECFDGDGLAL